MFVSTGVKRTVDNLGRVVIPRGVRGTGGFAPGAQVEVLWDSKNGIVGFKLAPTTCAVCGTDRNVVMIKDRYLCSGCIREAWEAMARKTQKKGVDIK